MRKGFSLVEMLVVVGIISVLTAAAVVSYTAFVKRANRARGAELVSNVKTAFESILQKEGAWPRGILAAGEGGNGEVDRRVGAVLARRNAMSLTYRKVERDGDYVYELTGLDQFGVVTPWAAALIKRRLANGGVNETTPVPEGGTIKSHRLRFAVDGTYKGLTKVTGEGVNAIVRANVCVWCAGMDGKFGTKDDIYSWTKAQEQK
jgi:prepilin-type N-terminal cleavage/methylation domain-containing protein